MLAVELCSLRDTLALLFVIGAVLTLGVIVAVWAHLGPGAGTLLTLAIGAVLPSHLSRSNFDRAVVALRRR